MRALFVILILFIFSKNIFSSSHLYFRNAEKYSCELINKFTFKNLMKGRGPVKAENFSQFLNDKKINFEILPKDRYSDHQNIRYSKNSYNSYLAETLTKGLFKIHYQDKAHIEVDMSSRGSKMTLSFPYKEGLNKLEIDQDFGHLFFTRHQYDFIEIITGFCTRF